MIDRELIEKAESGSVDAIISLGFAYYDREDGEENRGKAFELYTKALELDPDNARAINNLGNCYNNGVGVEENTERAMELYRKAAEMGYPNAQYNLADSLKKRHDPECLEWYQKAYEMLPDFILEQADCSITHKYKFKKYPISYDEAMEFESKAQEILDRYKNEAKLVITSRIHCAMPCIAMGIPVIYIHRGNHKEDTRLDVIKGLIPAYTPEQVDIINWNPKALNIEPFKKAIAGNAALHICNAAHDNHERKNSIKLLTKFAKCFENKALFDDKVLNLKLKTTSKLKEIKLFKILYSKKKILIWGASIYIQNFIRKYKIHNNNIVGFIDSNTNKESHFINEYEVFTPEILEVYKPELIVFAIKNNHKKIYKKIKKFLEHNYPDINLYQDIM